MQALRKQHLELLLKSNGLGSALSPELSRPGEVLPTGIEILDTLLLGGLLRGHLSEITGPVSSGTTSVLFSLLSRATQQGEIAAYIDTNQLDPFSASGSKVDLKRLLWVRCRQVGQALKAADILCRAGNFGVIALDLQELNSWKEFAESWHYSKDLWFRLQRAVEGTRTVLLVLACHPVSRVAARLSVRLRRKDLQWCGAGCSWKLVQGFSVEARLVRGGRNLSNVEFQVTNVAAMPGLQLEFQPEKRCDVTARFFSKN